LEVILSLASDESKDSISSLVCDVTTLIATKFEQCSGDGVSNQFCCRHEVGCPPGEGKGEC
jgi:hypothetical protein